MQEPESDVADQAPSVVENCLSPREGDVTRCIALGMGTAQTAARLGMSPQTVHVHLHNIFGKLGVRSRRELVDHALGRNRTTVLRRRPGRPELFDAYDAEPMMPAQWFAGAGRAAHLQPEKRLMFAVLSDAIDIVMQSRCPRSAPRRVLLEESAEWIASNDREWPYSFLNICDALGLEPDRLRAGIARFLERRTAIMPAEAGPHTGTASEPAPAELAQATG